MAATRTAARGLSTDELTTIRDGLAAGRKPKVTFTDSAGQIAGQTGQVVALTDPDASDEWVVVRFGRDELPFSPADLAVTGRAPRGAGTKRTVEPAPPAPEFKITRQPVPAPRDKPAREEAPVTPKTATPEAAAPAVPAPATAPANAPAAASVNGAAVVPKPARKAARPKSPAGLTVTLAYTDGEWTLAAQQGSKALAKPYVIKPAEALKMVSLVDVPGVHEAVEQIMAAERADAESQAEKLRAELAEIEARLAELREV